MQTPLDDDGQPPRRFYDERVSHRLISEMIGLCKGLIADGEVSETDCETLHRWIAGHPDVTVQYPGEALARRLLAIFADGVVTEEEREDLKGLLLDLTGETEEHDQPLNLSTRLPLDHPPPDFVFEDREFFFTGRMLYGTRRECEQRVLARGGLVRSGVTLKTDFLVIGPIASQAWVESTHGRKIMRAVEIRSQGHPLRIVSEESWIKAIDPR